MVNGKMSKLDWLSKILLIFGGFNWGLVGLLNYDLVQALFTPIWVQSLTYTLIGLSAIWSVYSLAKKYI